MLSPLGAANTWVLEENFQLSFVVFLLEKSLFVAPTTYIKLSVFFVGFLKFQSPAYIILSHLINFV